MVKKKNISPIEKLTRIVKSGFAAAERRSSTIEKMMEKGFAAVADDINEMRKTMATKADMNSGFLRIEERLASIESKNSKTSSVV